MRYALAAALITVSFLGCRASVNAEANVGGRDQDEEADEQPVEESEVSAEGVAAHEPSAMLGARPDLTLAQGKGVATCKCLVATVGEPSNPAFQWQADAPVTDPEKQLVVAFDAPGACEGVAADAPGPSYWGYQRDGENVIVVVELAKEGRPETYGAVIPRPGPGGGVWIKPRSKAVAFGRGQNGEAACRIDAGQAPAPAASGAP